MTGACADGLPAAIARYNAVLRRLEETGTVAAEMFEPLPDTAGFGQLGIEARLLSSYLRGIAHECRHGREDDEEPPAGMPDVSTIIALAPFMDRKDLTDLAKSALGCCGAVDAGVLVGLAPFMEHGEIGRIAREHMKAWFAGPRPEGPTPPEPPTPPDLRDEPAPVAPKSAGAPCCPADASARLRAVADRLAEAQEPGERVALAQELAQLAREQAEAARKAQV